MVCEGVTAAQARVRSTPNAQPGGEQHIQSQEHRKHLLEEINLPSVWLTLMQPASDIPRGCRILSDRKLNQQPCTTYAGRCRGGPASQQIGRWLPRFPSWQQQDPPNTPATAVQQQRQVAVGRVGEGTDQLQASARAYDSLHSAARKRQAAQHSTAQHNRQIYAFNMQCSVDKVTLCSISAKLSPIQ